MISQRLRGLNEEGEALEASFIPKLGKAFGDVGIQIMDQNGELRSTYDILNDLAVKWDDLSSAQRQYLGEKAAGNRQVKTLNAIMQNWDVVVDTIQKAEEASGAALEGNAKYMDSIEGRIVQFQSAFQDLARTTIDSSFVKSIVSAGADIVKLITQIGGLQKVLLPIVSIIAVAKWNSFYNSIKNIGAAFKTLKGEVSAARIGLSATIAVIGLVASAYSTWQAKQRELRDASIEAGRAQLDNSNALMSAVARYEQLASVTNRTESQEEAFKSAVNDVTEALGEKKSALDGLTAGTEAYTTKLTELTKKELENAVLVHQEAATAARQNINNTSSPEGWGVLGEWFAPQIRIDRGQLKNTSKEIEDLRNALTDVGQTFFDRNTREQVYAPRSQNFEDVLEFYYTAIDVQEELLRLEAKTGDKGYTENSLYKEAAEFVAAYENDVNTYIQQMYAVAEANQYIQSGSQVDTKEEFDTLADSLVKLTGAQGAAEVAVRAYVEEQANLVSAMSDVSDASSEASEGIEENITTLQSLIESLYSTSEAYKTLTDAIAEQDKAGIVSVETAQALVDLGSEYNEMLTLSAEGYTLNTEAVYEYIKAQNAEQKLKALEEIKDRQKALANLQKEEDTLAQHRIQNADALAENQRQQQIIRDEINGFAALVQQIDEATGALARYNAAKSSPNQDEDFNTGEKAYKDITEGLKTGKIGTDDFKTAVGFVLGENWQDELDKFGGSVEKAYKKAEETGKRYFGQEDERSGMANYRDDLVKAGYASFDKSTGEFRMLDTALDGSLVTIENISKALGISEDAVTSMFGLMEAYGAEFEFPEIVTDEEIEKTKELAEAVKEVVSVGGNASGSSVEELQKIKQTLTEDLDNYQKQLEAAPVGSDAYNQIWEDITKTKNALDAVETSLANLGENAEQPLTLQQTMEQLTSLQDTIISIKDSGIDVPVHLSEQYEQLNDLLALFGNGTNTNGTYTISVNDTNGAIEKIKEVESVVSEIQKNPDIPANIRATVSSTGEMTIDALQAFIDSDKDKPISIVIQSKDEATPVIEGIVDGEYGVATITVEVTEPDPVKVDTTLGEDGVEKALKEKQYTVTVTTKIKEEPAKKKTTSEKESNQPQASASLFTAIPKPAVADNEPVKVSVEPDVEGFVDKAIQEAQAQMENETVQMPVEMDMESVLGNVAGAGQATTELSSMASEAGIASEEVGKLKEAYRNLYDAADALDTTDPANTEEWNSATEALSSAAQNYTDAYNTLASKVSEIQSITINANTAPAIRAIDELGKRTVTITVQANPITLPGNASGTKNADPGVSLVDEKGAELIEHTKQGTFELGTNNGPRFTNLEKGDVVHTATETKKILSRLSRVGGFFRDGLNQAKSIIGGAFATGVSGGMSWNLINKTLKSVQNSGTKASTSKSSKGKKTSAKSLQKYTEKLFDWAEIRLERLKTITNTWLLNAAEAVGYIARNNELTSAIKSVEQEIENTTAAYDLYIKQADTIAKKAGLTQDIVDKVRSGEIVISQYNKDMQTKIQSYQEWYDKALACVDALSDLREQEKELAKQKLDNVIDHYNYRIDQLDGIVSQRESDLELMAKQGTEIEATEYQMSIDATMRKLEQLIEQREVLNEEFKDAVDNGFIDKESADWFEYSEKLADITRTITETKTALIELHDTANGVSITNLSWQLDALTNSANNINDFVNLHAAQALDETAETYLKLIENGMAQIRNLEEQNEKYREQQIGLDVLSEKYQDLQSNIESNNRAIMDMKVSQEEWNDAVLDLEINRLNKFRNTLTKTNDEYQRQKELQEALQNLEKAKAQRTMRIYRGESQGFVYESDQEAVRSAQTELEDVIENQLLDRIDDLIDAIEEEKNDTNVYDANGVLLGNTYSTPQLDTFSDILASYYDNIGSMSPFASLKSSLYDQLVSNLNGNSSNALNFSVGTMNINEVDNASEFAETIIDQLPNALIQALNKK